MSRPPLLNDQRAWFSAKSKMSKFLSRRASGRAASSRLNTNGTVCSESQPLAGLPEARRLRNFDIFDLALNHAR